MTEDTKGTLWACSMCGHVVATSGGQPEPLRWDDGHICGPYIPWSGERPVNSRPKNGLMVEDGILSFGEEDDDEGEE